MIKYLKHKEIDKAQWDKCIENAKNSLIYAYSWYLDVVSPGWDALVKDDYMAVMPLPWKKKFGIKYVYQPPYCQQLGVFFRNEEPLRIPVDFIRKIPSSFIHVHTKFNVVNEFTENLAKRLTLNNTCTLDLNCSYEKLFRQFSKNHKKNLKQASKNEFTLEHIKTENAIDFYVEYYRKKGLVKKFPFVIDVFPDLVYKLKEKCNVETRGLFSGGRLIASYISFEKGKRIIIHTSMNESGRKKRGVYYLINFIIKRYSNTERILDFAGSNIESIHYRNMGFGAKEEHYFSIYYYIRPWISKKLH